MEINAKDNQAKAIAAGLHILNTTIVPIPGLWSVEEVGTVWAAHLYSYTAHNEIHVASHVGHEATSVIASELLRAHVPVDRTPWDGRGLGLALQLKGRPLEGKVLSREEMEELGYSWRVLYRFEEDGLPSDYHRPGSSAAATEARETLRATLPTGHAVFVRKGETRTGAHNYYGVLLAISPDLGGAAPVDITREALAVLVDPLIDWPIVPGGGYSGSGEHGTKVMVYGEDESTALTNLAAQLGCAIGLPWLRVPFSVA